MSQGNILKTENYQLQAEVFGYLQQQILLPSVQFVLLRMIGILVVKDFACQVDSLGFNSLPGC